MAKEPVSRCACGRDFAFPEYHWPHCPCNPENLSPEMRRELEKHFSAAELAMIARMRKPGQQTRTETRSSPSP